jgi:hypothetical protein
MTYSPLAWQEWFALWMILLCGVLCWRLGAWSSRRSARARNSVAPAAATVAVAAAAAHYPPFRDIVGPWLRVPGGEGALACFGALVLVGIVWDDPNRRSSRPVLIAATTLVLMLLIGLSSGSLGWHYLGRRLRANYPDASGALQQTTGMTCAPAAASMLLHHAGIRISEGALAELANTTPIQGTAPYALARAVDHVARRHGLRARIQRVDYPRALRLQHPFVAFVKRPGVGGHALCVLMVEPARLRVIVPLSGTRDTIDRDEFLAEWDPTIFWIEPPSRG